MITEMLADYHEMKMWECFDEMYEYMSEHFTIHEELYNRGQLIIWGNHLGPAVYGWIDSAYDDWPWADVEQYVEEAYYSFELEVTERAFSNVIDNPVDVMWEKVEEAQYHQWMEWFYQALGYLL